MGNGRDLAILKPLWARDQQGGWGIHALKSLKLKPKEGYSFDYYAIESQMELMTNRPPGGSIMEMLASFGPTDSLLKQSILPVVVWGEGEPLIRCIGTAFVVSASGYIVTAAHVLHDPIESGYAKVHQRVGNVDLLTGPGMGVLIPLPIGTGRRGFHFIPLERTWWWGKWEQSPLLHQQDRIATQTDIAICKLPPRTDGTPYQALSLSLHPFSKGEGAFAVGYAEMSDVPVEYVNGKARFPEFDHELYVSHGAVTELYLDNHVSRSAPTPGPCFDFNARIPGKMSGAPIFGAGGAVIRGTVSRSYQDEAHATGCLIGPIMLLPLDDDMSLKKYMDAGTEGIAVMEGQGL
jgi:hypothetical protein